MFKSRYYDRYINIAFSIIVIFGIIMIGSASVGEPFPETISETGEVISALTQTSSFAIYNMFKQALFVASGWFFMMFVRKFFSTRLMNMKTIGVLYMIILVMMIMCLAFEPVNGAQAWIRLGPATLQPSEFAKPMCVVLLAFAFSEVPEQVKMSRYLSKSQYELQKQKRFKFGFWYPLGLCTLLFIICLFLQNDLGTSIIIFVICMVCFFSATHPFYALPQQQLWLVMLAGIALIVVGGPIVLGFLQDYQKLRITVLGDPLNSDYVLGPSYQLVNGMIAICHNGLLGAGLGNSTQKFGYIAEGYNDFISAIIFEELGVIGLALMVVPYTIIIIRLFEYSFEVKRSYHKTILVGIATYFFMHLFLNLGGVSGLIPMTGIPLLGISAGGSSTWSACAAIGIAQSIIKSHNQSRSRSS